MPIVRVVGGGPPTKEVFATVEDMPLILGDVRRALPKLKRELSRKYRVDSVELSSRVPRLRNPIEPSQIIVPACVGIVVYVIGPAAKAASTKVGDAIGDEIVKYVRHWLKGFSKKPRRRRKSKSGRE